MVGNDPLHVLLNTYGELGRQVAAEASVSGGLGAVPTVAARAVPNVDSASITRGSAASTWESLGETNELARQADAMQYDLGRGPCVDAVQKDHVFRSGDLGADRRWPDYGPLVAESLGLHSVLSIRLALDDDTAMAGLNLYSERREAFDDQAQEIALLLAAHAGLVVSRLLAKQKAANLEFALESNREIGVAIGVLMTTYKITKNEAFDLLRIASQHGHRKLRDVALDVAEIGTIEL